MGGLTNGWKSVRMEGWIHGCMCELVDAWMDGWKDGWMDGGMEEGWIGGVRVERMNEGCVDLRMDV